MTILNHKRAEIRFVLSTANRDLERNLYWGLDEKYLTGGSNTRFKQCLNKFSIIFWHKMSKWIKESHKESRECSWKREFVTTSLLKTKAQNGNSLPLPGTHFNTSSACLKFQSTNPMLSLVCTYLWPKFIFPFEDKYSFWGHMWITTPLSSLLLNYYY